MNATKEAEQASNRLNAVLRLSGQAVGVTRRELDELAESMQAALGFDDEAIRNGQATLLKFGNIHGQVFRDALEAIANYAAFTGDDFASAAQTVGKALQSPIEGTMMLERQLGKLSPAQEQQIKQLMEQNRLYEAQAVVLGFVQGKLIGVAKEMNTGITMAARDVANAWDDMLKAIGRTEAVQVTAKSSLGFVAQSLKDIQEIVEHGDWVEKTLAIFAFAGGWRDFKLSRPSVPASPPGPPPPMSFEKAIEGFPLTDVNFEAWRAEFDRLKKQRQEEARRAHAPVEDLLRALDEELIKKRELTREEEMLALLQTKRYATATPAERELAQARARNIDLVSKEQKFINEEMAHWEDLKRKREAANRELREAGEHYRDLIDWTRKYDRELELINRLERAGPEGGGLTRGEAAAARIDLYQRLGDEAIRSASEIRDVERASEQMWQALTSHAEDAIVNFNDLGSVVRGLEKDLLRIGTRTLITEPFGKWAKGAFTGSGLGGWLSNLLGGGMNLHTPWLGAPEFAHGGEFTVGGMGGTDSQLVAFRATPGEQVTVETPAQRRRDREGKNVEVNVSMVVNTPDASSFRLSKSQIEADLAMMMQRGLRNL